MVSIADAQNALVQLGARLRQARIARNESMLVLADRIDVSVPTLRDMEHGRPTVQIGYWMVALWALGELESLNGILAPEESLLARARAKPKVRLRAYKRREP